MSASAEIKDRVEKTKKPWVSIDLKKSKSDFIKNRKREQFYI